MLTRPSWYYPVMADVSSAFLELEQPSDSLLAGGINLAVPVALSGAKSKTGFLQGGIINTDSSAGNGVSQNANGGAGSAVGSYGSHNWFGKREEELEERGEDMEERGYTAPRVKAPSVLVYGSGNGGSESLAFDQTKDRL